MADVLDPAIPRPFSVNGLAEHWDCSPSMVRKLINQGRLGHFRLGILIRIPVAAVEEFECENTIGGIPATAIESTLPPAQESGAPPLPAVADIKRTIARARRRFRPIKRPGHGD